MKLSQYCTPVSTFCVCGEGSSFLEDFGAENLTLEVIASELTGSRLTQKCQEGCMTFSASTNPQYT